jgi:uncharacterized protein (DUF1501 family)
LKNLAAMRDGLGVAWANATVLVATEFGRTAAVTVPAERIMAPDR